MPGRRARRCGCGWVSTRARPSASGRAVRRRRRPPRRPGRRRRARRPGAALARRPVSWSRTTCPRASSSAISVLHRLKDIDRPERISQLAAEGLRAEFPPLRGAEPVKPPPHRSGAARCWLAAARRGGRGRGRDPACSRSAAARAAPWRSRVSIANAVGAVDASTGKIVASVPVGTTPGSVAFGEGSIWVTNADDHSVSQDRSEDERGRADDPGRQRAGRRRRRRRLRLGREQPRRHGLEDRPARRTAAVDTNHGRQRPDAGSPSASAAVWVANSSDRTRDADRPAHRNARRARFRSGAGADGVAVGAGAVWVTSESSGSVARIDPRTGSVTQTINVGSGPSAVAVGAGAVWVANSLDGTVSRIDPASNRVRGDDPGRRRPERHRRHGGGRRLGQQRARRHALADRPGPERGRPDGQDREPARGRRPRRRTRSTSPSAPRASLTAAAR